MDNVKYCPNCGAKIDSSELFCSNCGSRLTESTDDKATQVTNNTSVDQSNTNVTSRQAIKKQNKHSKRNKIILLVVLIVALLGYGSYLFGNHYYSKDAVLSRAMASIKSDKNTDKYFVSDSSKIAANDQTLKPLSTYAGKHGSYLSSLKTQLTSNGHSDDYLFSVENDGKKWLLFPDYEVHVKPVNPTVSTTQDDASVTLNGKKLGVIKNQNIDFKLGTLMPGYYTVAVSKKLSLKTLTNSQSLFINTDSEPLDMPLTTVKFTVNAGANADVYINDQKIGTADKDGNLKVGDTPYSSNMYIYAIINNNGTDVKSNKYQISQDDNGNDIELIYPGAVSKDDASSLLTNFFDDLSQMVSDSSNKFDADSYFVDGSSSKDAKYFANWAVMESNNSDLSDGVGISADVQSIVPSNSYSTVNGTIKYVFYGAGKNDDSDHIQVYSFTSKMKKTSNGYKIISLKEVKKVKDYDKDSSF